MFGGKMYKKYITMCKMHKNAQKMHNYFYNIKKVRSVLQQEVFEKFHILKY